MSADLGTSMLRPRSPGERPHRRKKRRGDRCRERAQRSFAAGDLLVGGRQADALVSRDLAVAVAERLSHQESARAFRESRRRGRGGRAARQACRPLGAVSSHRRRCWSIARWSISSSRTARRASSAPDLACGGHRQPAPSARCDGGPRSTDVWVSSCCSQANEQASSMVSGSARACRATGRSSVGLPRGGSAAIRWGAEVVECACRVWVGMCPRRRSWCREGVAAPDTREARPRTSRTRASGSRGCGGRSLGPGDPCRRRTSQPLGRAERQSRSSRGGDVVVSPFSAPSPTLRDRVPTCRAR